MKEKPHTRLLFLPKKIDDELLKFHGHHGYKKINDIYIDAAKKHLGYLKSLEREDDQVT